MNDDFPPTPKNCLAIAGLVAGFFLLMALCCVLSGGWMWIYIIFA